MSASLAQMISADDCVIAPGVYDAMSARLAEGAGFAAVYMTGAGTSFARLGKPDIGLTTMSEVVANARSIVDAVSVPVIADADTGYGNALNVMRTVQEFENAGVQAIHIEDQKFPKRCGHFHDKKIEPVEVMAGKLRAAVDARRSEDFLIIARTDAIAAEGFEAAVERAHRYEDAGADVVFLEAPPDRAQIESIPGLFKKPTLLNMAEGKTPFVSATEARDMGFRIMIVPSTHRVTVLALREYFKTLHETGRYEACMDRVLPWGDWIKLVGLHDYDDILAGYESPE